MPLVGFALTLASFAADRADAIAEGPDQPNITYAISQQGDSVHGYNLVGASQDPGLRVRYWGNLRTAKAVAVIVPGIEHFVSEFDDDDATTPQVARTLPQQARALRSGPAGQNIAVIAWLGYRPPTVWAGALTSSQIRTGAANLAGLTDFMQQINQSARLTWICHSYGSLICASALRASSPNALAMVGSPGIHTDRAADLPTTAEIWAGRGSGDVIELTGLLILTGGGYGMDPAAPAFGARDIPCDPHTRHGEYFKQATAQLAALQMISRGNAVTL
jgi:hypothetical protein